MVKNGDILSKSYFPRVVNIVKGKDELISEAKGVIPVPRSTALDGIVLIDRVWGMRLRVFLLG